MNRGLRRTVWVFFGLYALAMLYLLFFQRANQALWQFQPTAQNYLDYLRYRTNLVPFSTVRNMLSMATGGYPLRFSILNLGGNIAMFVPLGVFLPLLWEKQRRFGVLFLTVVGVICLVELLQVLTTLGSCDVDDLILNVLGASLGYILWRLLAHAKRSPTP